MQNQRFYRRLKSLDNRVNTICERISKTLKKLEEVRSSDFYDDDTCMYEEETHRLTRKLNRYDLKYKKEMNKIRPA